VPAGDLTACREPQPQREDRDQHNQLMLELTLTHPQRPTSKIPGILGASCEKQLLLNMKYCKLIIKQITLNRKIISI
jgi:hypothetical protein